jgi:hypothetical protein
LVVPDVEGVVDDPAPGVAAPVDPVPAPGVPAPVDDEPVDPAPVVPDVLEPDVPDPAVVEPVELGLVLEPVAPVDPVDPDVPAAPEVPDPGVEEPAVEPELSEPGVEDEDPAAPVELEPEPDVPAWSALRLQPANMMLSNPAAKTTFDAFKIEFIICPFTNVDNLTTLLTALFPISSQPRCLVGTRLIQLPCRCRNRPQPVYRRLSSRNIFLTVSGVIASALLSINDFAAVGM